MCGREKKKRTWQSACVILNTNGAQNNTRSRHKNIDYNVNRQYLETLALQFTPFCNELQVVMELRAFQLITGTKNAFKLVIYTLIS